MPVNDDCATCDFVSPALPVQPSEAALRAELGQCVLGNSWLYTAVGVGVAVPVGVRYRSYTPLAYAGLVGTGLDLVAGYTRCKAQRDALARCTERLKSSSG